MTEFDISSIVLDPGLREDINISGVTKTLDAFGDATESYVSYAVSGVIQIMDGSEEEVAEGILEKEDAILFVDEDETNADKLQLDNYVTVSGSVCNAIFRVVNVIHNIGHYEVQAKRILNRS